MEEIKVFSAINAVQAELAEIGITKSKKNAQQGYLFRGIDDIYNALAPLLSKHKLCVLPRIISRTSTEKPTARGGVLFYVVVEAEFHFVSAEDGSSFVVRNFGEAMDSADKATNKAMSAAYKYACLQTFCIPTEGDNDADSTTTEVVSKGGCDISAAIKRYAQKHPSAIKTAPATPAEKKEEKSAPEPVPAQPAPVAHITAEHIAQINACANVPALNECMEKIKSEMGEENFAKFRNNFVTHYKRRYDEIIKATGGLGI